MPTAPQSLPPPLNASRSFLQALHALTPLSHFRVRQPHAQSRSPPDAHVARNRPSPKPPMPMHVADTLLHLIDFLEEHHKREDGLYQRDAPASGRETLVILRVLRSPCDEGSLPDLAAFSPHSITAAIKEVLGQDFEPLIPYAMSQILLESTATKDEHATLNEILATVKRLAPTRRELLKVLLIHLHHISTSISSRMDAKRLAKHIGVLVIRLADDTGNLSGMGSKVVKQRRRIARLMIENANALPYNEENRSSGPKKTAVETLTQDKASVLNALANKNVGESTDRVQAHYVQVLWDPDRNAHTEETLQELLSRFGHVATLAINESGNRAIAAFRSADSAQAAAEAAAPGVRIRRRKQRNQESTLSVSSDFTTPTPSPAKEVDLQTSAEKQPVNSPSGPTIEPAKLEIDPVGHFNEDTSIGMVASADCTVVESPTFLYKLERPPSLLLVQKAMKTMQSSERMALEDVESPRSSAQAVNDANDQRTSPSKINEVVEEEERSVVEPMGMTATIVFPDKSVEVGNSLELQRRRSLKQPLHVDTAIVKSSDSNAKLDEITIETRKQRKSLFSPPTRSKIGLISDLKSMISRKRTPRTGNESRAADAVEPIIGLAEPSPQVSTEAIVKPLVTETRSIKTQTNEKIHSLAEQAIDTDDLEKCESSELPDVHATASDPSVDLHAQVEGLSICLSEVKHELTDLASALSASRHSDVDKAILRAHERVISRITLSLNADSSCGSSDGQHSDHNSAQSGSATSEFVSFLEMRSSTQVKILEAEVRAGQELLRLHRSQHQKEVVELETEITSLRVIQNETEKMCADLRNELRKCRTELTCHVASAASMQRERRDADEKLIICENKLRAKEQELLQLQVAHDEMRDVAGSTQRRLEKHRADGLPIQPQDSVTQPETENQLPQLAAFLKVHRQHEPARKPDTKLSTVWLRPGQYANTEALATMKKNLEERIRQQTEATKKSLRELHAFGTRSAPLEDDDSDLKQLEQRLVSAQADLHSTMDTSRRKLAHLLDPTARSMDSRPIDLDKNTSTFDPAWLVESLLANALFAETNQDDLLLDAGDDFPFEPVELLTPSWQSPPSDTQSEMYRKWIHTRARQTSKLAEPITRSRATAAEPTPHANDSSLQQAQASMLRFQQTLASIKRPTS